MNNCHDYWRVLITLSVSFMPLYAHSHDTTHIHPLITDRISQLISDNDAEGNYSEIYMPPPTPDPKVSPSAAQHLYWGADFDSGKTGLTIDYLLKDQLQFYDRYTNVIDGVVQEDVPATNVINHFF